MKTDYDIIVAGGGHAGVEACWAAAKQKMRVLLVTKSVDNIAQMSCNPSIGGLAKSHLVKELDILGGLMPDAADRAAIQFKMLNSSKGPAVWALRVQTDKMKYAGYVRQKLEKNRYIDIIQDEVVDIDIKDKVCTGVTTELNGKYTTGAVIITSGTFLGGRIHMGTKQIRAGRLGESSADKLTQKLVAAGFETMRLKTGTPPRISGSSIDFSVMEAQGSDEKIHLFSFRNKKPFLKQVPCYVAHTSEVTHELIDKNKHKTALFSGRIKGTGPRYCPSIEDKVNRFYDKTSHRLFIEPEGLYTNEYYINGFSSSLPVEIQKKALWTVKGLENAKFVRPAYAIEYDYFPAYQVKLTLETRYIDNLYFAGQINGTSGYEEAACQGFIAGINAVLKLQKKEPFILDRSQAYIGVLIDDLITKDIREPYRMFTALAEYRLELRHDNADARLLPFTEKFKLLSRKELNFLKKRLENIEELAKIFKKTNLRPSDINEASIYVEQFDHGVKLEKLIKRPDTNIEMIVDSGLFGRGDYSDYELKQAEILVKYEGYIARQQDMIDRFKRNERIKLPTDLNYKTFTGLKTEAIEKLNKVKPVNVGQASRIAGISPADISVILVNLKKNGIV